MRKLLTLLCFVFLLAADCMYGQTTNGNSYNLIPYPAEIKTAKGFFTITKETALIINAEADKFKNEEAFLTTILQSYLGNEALKPKATAKSNAIVLQYDATIAAAECYHLDIDDKQVVIAAKDPAGMFYGIETLRQLLPADVENGKGDALKVPAVTIQDRPSYAWRGMMLDVSRHFFSVDYLHKFVDMMALYKMNKLHLHLTDDQGWRIEIKKYPELTQKSAWRDLDRNDSACIKKVNETGNTDFEIDKRHFKKIDGKLMYGGYYTQDEMKAFIQYAASRHIEVIPEIDMPGHMQAAVKIFPYLSCDSSVNNAQGFSVPICPCNEKVIDFAKDIFTEIVELFPSKYVHIGGDEVDQRNWEKSAMSKAFMKERGYTETSQIQQYFNGRMIEFFKSKGKIMIGWDEIAEAKIDSTPMVMFWRVWAKDALLKAAKNGNKVIMTPDGPFYFDAAPDNNSLYEVYHYNPLDEGYKLNKQDEKKIVGVQANLWSEIIPSEKRADYLILPRMTALAELGWTNKPMYDSYLQRLNTHYPRLDHLNVHYRLPDLEGMAENNVFVGKTSFFKSFSSNYFKVHYTTDGGLPLASSPVMSKPVIIDKTFKIKLALFTPAGRRGDLYTLNFSSTEYIKPTTDIQFVAGLKCELYKGSFSMTTEIKGKPDNSLTAPEVSVPKAVTVESFGLKFNGFINVPQTAVYTFYLNCDDGGVLKIAGGKVVDNDGLHPAKEKGGQIALQKGAHPIAVDFIEGGGGYKLELKYSIDNGTPKAIPASWFKYSK